MKKIFVPPDDAKDVAEVWIDPESSLPVLVQFKMTKDRSEQTIRFQDFHWNIDLDPKLFDTTLPKGYTDDTPSLAVPPKSSATTGGSR